MINNSEKIKDAIIHLAIHTSKKRALESCDYLKEVGAMDEYNKLIGKYNDLFLFVIRKCNYDGSKDKYITLYCDPDYLENRGKKRGR